MQHFGLAPAAPFAAAVIVTELLGSLLILSGWLRWLGALWLGGFTLDSMFLANRYWAQIGRALGRENVCQYGIDLGSSLIIKKKKLEIEKNFYADLQICVYTQKVYDR